jgi:hypothetical protein
VVVAEIIMRAKLEVVREQHNEQHNAPIYDVKLKTLAGRRASVSE